MPGRPIYCFLLHQRTLPICHTSAQPGSNGLNPFQSIPNKADFHREILAYLSRAFIKMYQLDVPRYRQIGLIMNVQSKEIHSCHKDHVKFFEPIVNFRRPRGKALPIKWMVRRKCQASMSRAGFSDHRSSQSFSQLYKRIISPAFCYSRTAKNGRTSGGTQ